LAGATRRQLQGFEEAGALHPFRPGRKGRGGTAYWSLADALGLVYGRAFLDANCDPSWAYMAAAWVARQHPGDLTGAFREGRTLVSLSPDGQGRLVVPYLRPGASREVGMKVAQLNLQACYERVRRRALGS
jgi:hypothetical protein